jgi:hypothetical protein
VEIGVGDWRRIIDSVDVAFSTIGQSRSALLHSKRHRQSAYPYRASHTKTGNIMASKKMNVLVYSGMLYGTLRKTQP